MAQANDTKPCTDVQEFGPPESGMVRALTGDAGSVAWRLACIILAVLQAVAAGACLDALLGLPADASPWLSIAYTTGTVTLWLAAVGVASLAAGGHGARHGRHCDEEEDR